MKPNFKDDWRKAGITNDFIFGNVMQVGNNCRDLLRAILPELGIRSVRINTQKDIRDQRMQKGVRLDVYAKDERGRIYNIEMQVIDQHNLGKRVRYYRSKVDMDPLGIGKDYDQGHHTSSFSFRLTRTAVTCDGIPSTCGVTRSQTL